MLNPIRVRVGPKESQRIAVSTIGSAVTHKDVLENPDHISKHVLSKGLDAGTTFARNILARVLQTATGYLSRLRGQHRSLRAHVSR